MRRTGPKTVLLTGASSGIGAAVARELAWGTHRLALTARRADLLEALADDLRSRGAEVLVLPADLADPATPERLASAVVERFGGLDVLINNAGFGLPQTFGAADPGAIRRQIEVNLTAPILLTRRALPLLLASRGMVINVGSSITSVAIPIFGVYGATKAGLAYWNDALRREVRPRGVRVCLVEPGPVATEFLAAATALREKEDPGQGPAPSLLERSMREPPPQFLRADAADAARRVVRLLDRPRRRLSFLRRTVWPYRMLGGLVQVAPWLGDWSLAAMAGRRGPKDDMVQRRAEDSDDAAPPR